MSAILAILFEESGASHYEEAIAEAWFRRMPVAAAVGLSRKTIGRLVTAIAMRNEHERSFSQAWRRNQGALM